MRWPRDDEVVVELLETLRAASKAVDMQSTTMTLRSAEVSLRSVLDCARTEDAPLQLVLLHRSYASESSSGIADLSSDLSLLLEGPLGERGVDSNG